MRLLILCALGVWITTVLILFGARQMTRQPTLPAPLPLPDANGCWDGWCLFSVRQDDLPDALAELPRTLSVGPQAAPNAYHVQLRADAGAPRRAVIQAAPDSVMISWDWSVPDSPPLLTLGDLLRVYGPPDRVDRDRQLGPVLWYAGHSAAVAIQPDAAGIGWLRLAPGDPVTRLTAIRPDLYAETATLPPGSATASGPWTGFATWVFRP